MQDIKRTIFDLVMTEIEKQIETAEKGKSHAVEESKAHKGATASRYDTFKEEAQYLAGGQSARLQDLNNSLSLLKSVRDMLVERSRVMVGAIVELEEIETAIRTYYFILPAGGGTVCEVEERQYLVLTPKAPITRTIMGKTQGNDFLLTIKGASRRMRIISVE